MEMKISLQYHLKYTVNLQHPSIFIPYYDNFICLCGFGTIESLLEPHMKKVAGSTQIDIGITFLIIGALYMVSCVSVGLVRKFVNNF